MICIPYSARVSGEFVPLVAGVVGFPIMSDAIAFMCQPLIARFAKAKVELGEQLLD